MTVYDYTCGPYSLTREKIDQNPPGNLWLFQGLMDVSAFPNLYASCPDGYPYQIGIVKNIVTEMPTLDENGNPVFREDGSQEMYIIETPKTDAELDAEFETRFIEVMDSVTSYYGRAS